MLLGAVVLLGAMAPMYPKDYALSFFFADVLKEGMQETTEFKFDPSALPRPLPSPTEIPPEPPTLDGTRELESFPCRHTDTVSDSSTGYRTICAKAARRWKNGPDVLSGFTIFMTTYGKSTENIMNTLRSYKKTGVLSHPALREFLVHINACKCSVTRTLEKFLHENAPWLKYRFLCHTGNRLHPLVLLHGVAEIRTPFALVTEDDRPASLLRGRTWEETRAHVRRGLDKALTTIHNPNTPYVFLQRSGPSHDDVEKLMKLIADSGGIHGGPRRRRTRSGKVSKTIEKLTKAVDLDNVTNLFPGWYHEYNNITKCWTYCVDLAGRDRRGRKHICKQQKKKVGWEKLGCQYIACRERMGYILGYPSLSELCLSPFTWALPSNTMNNTWLIGEQQRDDVLICRREKQWSNGPAIFNLPWYLDRLAKPWCEDPVNSGLMKMFGVDHFGWYGRRMEKAMTKKMSPSKQYAKEGGPRPMKGGYVRCSFGYGLFDHQELESFDLAKVTFGRGGQLR
eukprot:Hpha_TRINITY_DN5409_c0_g1::TRINITY_DN5409_c0_g1_i1::g.192348::m.192348